MIAVVGKTRAHSAFHNSTFILAIIAPSMRPDALHQPSASPICRFVSAGVHRCSGGLTSGSDGHRRLPRIRGVRSSGVCSASGESTYSAASGLNRTPTVLATPSVSVPLNLQPRRVRSHCRVSPTGSFERYFCGQFSVCLFRIRGREPRSIFPLAKVGLTVQRKTSRRIYCINCYQSPPSRSY